MGTTCYIGATMSSAPFPRAAQSGPTTLQTGAIIRRMLRDYVRGHWGLLALAILCLLLTSALGGLVPLMVNWEIKLIFIRRQEELLLPLALAVTGVVSLRAVTLYFGRMTLDSMGEKAVATAQRPASSGNTTVASAPNLGRRPPMSSPCHPSTKAADGVPTTGAAASPRRSSTATAWSWWW